MRANASFWPSRARGRRRAAALAMLAVAIQCFVVQPHIEPTAFAHSVVSGDTASATAPAAVATPSTAEHGVAAVCLICQAALSGRANLPAATPAAPLNPQTLHASAPLPTAPALSATPSHNWQSGAPPSFV